MAEQTLGIRIKIDSDTGKLTVLNKEFDSLKESSARASSQLSSFSDVAKIAAGAIVGIFTFNGIKDSIKSTLDLADSLNKMSQKVGVSVDALYAMQAAGKLSDVSMETLEKGLVKFNKGLGLASMGSGDTANALKNLGISLKDSSGHLKMSDQYLIEVADKFKVMPDGIAKTTLSMQLFGKSGQDLIPLLNGGGESLKEFSGIMDKDSAQAAERLNDSFTRIGLSFEGNKTQIMTGMLPAMESMAKGLEDSAKWMHNNSITLEGLTHYVKEAGVIAATYYGTTLAISAVTALKEIDIATKIATISQINFNTVVKLNPWVLIASSIAVATGALYEYKTLTDSILQSQGKSTGSKNFMTDLNVINQATSKDAKIDIVDDLRKKAYAKHLSSSQAYNNENDSLRWSNSERDKLKKNYEAYKEEYLALNKLYNDLTAKPKQITPQYDLEDSAKKDAAAKKAAAERLKVQQAYDSIEKESYKSSHNDYENSIKDIEDKGKAYLDQGIKQIDVDKYVNGAKSDLKKKYTDKADAEALAAIKVFNDDQLKLEFQADQDRINALETYNDGLVSAQIATYEAIGDTSSAYYLQEEEKMKKLAETGWYTNEQMLAIKTKDNEDFRKEQWKKDNKFWSDLFDGIEKSMDNQIFDAMSGKWTKFGDWLKDFWGSLTTSIMRSVSSMLSTSIIGSIKDAVMGSSTSGGLSTTISRLAGAGIGSNASVFADGTTDLSGAITTAGGTVIDAAGQITQNGTDLSSVTSALSTASNAYSIATAGLSSMVANGFAQGAAYTYNGLTAMGVSSGTAGSIAGGIGNFGAGMAAPWSTGAASGTAAQAGAMVGGAALGAAGGYALGSIGDKAFGADTKAASYGAIGGAIGSLAGPLGAVAGAIIGSLIGGAFGSTKVQQSGLHFAQTTGGDEASIKLVQSWAEMRKKSWFSSKEWNEYSDLSASQLSAIEGIFDTYDYLLGQLGSVDKITIAAGNYTQDKFESTLAKSFISTFTGIKQTITTTLNTVWGNWEIDFGKSNPIFDEVYNQWVDYAKSINKSVTQALTDSVGTFVQSSRSFEIWSLERSGDSKGSLQKQAEWAQQSFNLLSESMGVTGLTVETFTKQYEAAVKSNFSNETITQWASLGTALMDATNAQDKYKEAMATALDTVDNSAQKAIDTLNALSNAFNMNIKSQQITASIAQMLAPDQISSAQIGANSARSQYADLQSFYGVSLSDTNFLTTMQSSLSKDQSNNNVAMWDELAKAFQGAYSAEKQLSSLIEQENENKLAEQQKLYDAQQQAAQQAMQVQQQAAEERAKQLEEERKTLEALHVSSKSWLRGFTETTLKDDPLNLAAYQLKNATADFNDFSKATGAIGVSLSSFAGLYEDAIAKNFTTDNVTLWQNLGDSIIKVNDAQKAYNDSLKQTVNTGFMKDMMLSKVNTSNSAVNIKEMVNQQAVNNTNQLQQIAALYEIVKVLKQQLNEAKFPKAGVPA